MTTTNLPFDPDALREKYRRERDKRLRDDGNQQYIEVTGEFAHFIEDPYVEPGLVDQMHLPGAMMSTSEP